MNASLFILQINVICNNYKKINLLDMVLFYILSWQVCSF